MSLAAHWIDTQSTSGLTANMDQTQIILEDKHNATEGPPVEIRSLDNIYTIVEIITAVAAVIGM